MNEQVRQLAYEMRLIGVHQNFESRASEAVKSGLHPLEFLNLLLQDEKNYRKDRLSKSLTKRAKFRHQADMEDIDLSYDRGLTKPKIKDLMQLGFIKQKVNLLILGKTGAGKTHLAISLGRKICESNLSVMFLPVTLMFEEIIVAKSAGKFLGYLNKLNQTQVLILDDFGLRNYTHDEANVLVELLEARIKKGPVIVTSQTDPLGWYKLFEDPVIAEAVVDRLQNPSQKIQLIGPSYREKLASPNLTRGKSLELNNQMA